MYKICNRRGEYQMHRLPLRPGIPSMIKWQKENNTCDILLLERNSLVLT